MASRLSETKVTQRSLDRTEETKGAGTVNRTKVFGGPRGIPQGFNRISELGRARESAGLTQKELAERAGLIQPYISWYENCNREPSVTHAIKIANVLDLPVESLFQDWL